MQRKSKIDSHVSEIVAHPAGQGDPEASMTTAELAAWLGVSRVWLEQQRWKGQGPPWVRLSPGLIRYRRDEVLAWLDARSHRSTAEYESSPPAVKDVKDGSARS
jgi:predicted DNA-binding transcriptional regulator AlpA